MEILLTVKLISQNYKLLLRGRVTEMWPVYLESCINMSRCSVFFCLAVTFVFLLGTADALLPVQISVAILCASHQRSRAAVVVTD